MGTLGGWTIYNWRFRSVGTFGDHPLILMPAWPPKPDWNGCRFPSNWQEGKVLSLKANKS